MAKVTFEKCVVIDGRAFISIAEGQIAILAALFAREGDTNQSWEPAEIAERILSEKAQVLAALNLNTKSRPATQKAFGATRKSRTKPEPAMELPIAKSA
jgi:hypothetical protein